MRTLNPLAVFGFVALSLTRLDAASTIQFATSSVTAAEDTGSVVLQVRRLDDLNAVSAVEFTTTDGSAQGGLKYVATSGTLTFAPGESEKSILVSLINDGVVGSTQSFQVVLNNPSGGSILGIRDTATVRITDNDKGLQFEFGRYSVREDEGAVQVGVVRGDDGRFPVMVECFTSDVTARNGVDYTAKTNTLSFDAGETVKVVTIAIPNDALKEPDRTLRVTLTNPRGGAALGTLNTTTVTITDNDPGVQLEFGNYWVGEDEGNVTINVQRGRDADADPFTVDYVAMPGTALPGQDYVETRGTLTFAAEEVSQPIRVPVLSNDSSVADRQFRVVLSNPSAGSQLGTNRAATVTVLDTTGKRTHRISHLALQSDGSALLTFEGGVHERFKDYFDLYPLEISTDLATWVPWMVLQRTNAATNALTYSLPMRGGAGQMFFRTSPEPFITPYRQPTGPFRVGSNHRLVTDRTRRNRYGVSTNGSFMITLLYPAVVQAGRFPDRHEYPWAGDNAARADASKVHDRARSLVTHTYQNAEWATNATPCPVVLYSHGARTSRTERFELGSNLASHGYVVVLMDHANVIITQFPDGATKRGSASLDELMFQDRVDDFAFVLQLLETWNREDPEIRGRLDFDRLATMGWSWGGAVAGEFAYLEEKVKATIFLDTNLDLGRFQTAGLSKPFIGIDGSEFGVSYSIFDRPSTRDAIWFWLEPSLHDQFSDYYWRYFPGDILGGREISRTVNDWTLWFLERHLRGQDTPMPTMREYPRIRGFKQK